MIYLVTADYRNPPVAPPYGVEADSAQEAKDWFRRCFPQLKVFGVAPLPHGCTPPPFTMRKRDEEKMAVRMIREAYEGITVGDEAFTANVDAVINQIHDIYTALEKLEETMNTLANDWYVNHRYVGGRLIDFLDREGS